MSTQRSPRRGYVEELYKRYRKTIEDYCKQTVLPSLRKKHDDEDMLKELSLRCWPTLKEVGLICFRDLVYNEMKSKATKAIIALIQKEREGEEIDRALLKNVLEIYVEVGMKRMEYAYVEDFETFMIQDTKDYYSRKASSWIQEYSFHHYMLKAKECLKEERERVTHYLHISTEPKLVKVLEEVFEFGSNKTVKVPDPSPEDLITSIKI